MKKVIFLISMIIFISCQKSEMNIIDNLDNDSIVNDTTDIVTKRKIKGRS